jgi:two-component system sensor histidine kinase EvgS
MKHDAQGIYRRVGMLTIDEFGVITSFDPVSESLFGYSANQVIGRELKVLLSEPVLPIVGPSVVELQHQNAFQNIGCNREAVAHRQNGDTFPIWFSINEILLGNQRILAGSIFDLSAQKAMEESQTKLTALVASSTDAIIGKTVKGIVTSWNPAAEKMFGYTALEMIGEPLTRLLPPDRLDEERRILTDIRNGKTVNHFETIRISKNGEKFAVSVNISPIKDGAGNIIGASKIARDITEQKLAEEELRQYRDHLQVLVADATVETNAIIQTAGSGIITIDAKGTIKVFNPAAERLFGWTKEELAGKNISKLMNEPFSLLPEGYLSRLTNSRERNIIGDEHEVHARRKDGSTFPAHLSVGHAELSEFNHFFVAFVTDISEQKKIEDKLRKAKEDAETGMRSKAAFIANMSHEIRTPMNSIIGFTGVVLEDIALSAESHEHLQIVLSSAKELMTIINDILDVSKLESGRFDLEAVTFHLPNALTNSLKLVNHHAMEKGLGLTFEYQADLPLRFTGDPTRLRQVILNLVSNAIKFTADGQIVVAIKSWNKPDMLHFSICDTGIGMTSEQVSKIFKSFSQADSSTTRQFGGTGLGTAICKQIIELMGGQIWVESEFGKGSTFHFTVHLPQALSDETCLYEDEIAIVDTYSSPRTFQVLLAEDIEANATLVSTRLKDQGHHVESGHFDLILMDVMMPEMNGLEATRKIREWEKLHGGHIPILALTASVMKEEFEICMTSGMDGVHAKPIDFSDLLYAMEKIVPEERGQLNTTYKIKLSRVSEVNFSPLHSVVDLQRAVRTWRDSRAYAQALLSFAANRINDADTMEQLLLENPDSVDAARYVAHALKGLAGNLYITKVAEQAIKIDAELKAKHCQAAVAEIGRLRPLLMEAATAIGKIAFDEQKGEFNAKVFAPGVVADLFAKLTSALRTLNPDSVEPILLRLAEYLSNDKLAPIREALDAFDFDTAEIRAVVVASSIDAI